MSDKFLELFIEKTFYNELFSKLKFYIYLHRDEIKVRSYTLSLISYKALDDFTVKSVLTRNRVGDAIESHLLIIATLEIKGHSKYGYEVDNAEIWLDVTVSYQLNNGLHHFSVGNITEYDATNKEMKQTPDFTLEFVPYYRKNEKETVWDKAKDEQGVVKDPITKKVMDIEEPWDMGHKPGHEFRKHQQSAADRKITRKQFLDEYNNPNSYRPELPESNRSHIGEDKMDFYFGS